MADNEFISPADFMGVDHKAWVIYIYLQNGPILSDRKQLVKTV